MLTVNDVAMSCAYGTRFNIIDAGKYLGFNKMDNFIGYIGAEECIARSKYGKYTVIEIEASKKNCLILHVASPDYEKMRQEEMKVK